MINQPAVPCTFLCGNTSMMQRCISVHRRATSRTVAAAVHYAEVGDIQQGLGLPGKASL